MADVSILMGSQSDWKVMKRAADMLDELGISNDSRIISAHRTPEVAADFAGNAAKNGIKIIIAAAGMAAHLAGAMAAQSHLPIIGVPLAASSGPNGMDALLSTVQMPPGVPVATVAIGKAGAKNAAVLALQILALADDEMKSKIINFRKEQSQAVIKKDAAIQ